MKSSLEIIRAAAIGFESGFTGFTELSTTSLVGVGRLLLNGVSFSCLFADASRIGEKKVNKESSSNNPYPQTEDVLCNPVNPDSKPGVRGKFQI
jgi:hypothetical protein